MGQELKHPLRCKVADAVGFTHSSATRHSNWYNLSVSSAIDGRKRPGHTQRTMITYVSNTHREREREREEREERERGCE